MQKFKLNFNNPGIQLYSASIDNNQFVILKSSSGYKYFTLKKHISFTKEGNEYFLVSKDINLSLYAFHLVNKVQKWVKNIDRLYKKRLFLKGLGYRVEYKVTNKEKKTIDSSIIDFKVGNSHMISMEVKDIPTKIKFRFRKNKIINIESKDKVFLGNFTYKIFSQRVPDTYKGKGFWYRYQKRNLKLVNKK